MVPADVAGHLAQGILLGLRLCVLHRAGHETFLNRGCFWAQYAAMATQIGNATRGQPPPQRAQRHAAAAASPLGAARRRTVAAVAASRLTAGGGGDIVAQLQEEVRRLDGEAGGLQGEVDRLTAQVGAAVQAMGTPSFRVWGARIRSCDRCASRLHGLQHFEDTCDHSMNAKPMCTDDISAETWNNSTTSLNGPPEPVGLQEPPARICDVGSGNRIATCSDSRRCDSAVELTVVMLIVCITLRYWCKTCADPSHQSHSRRAAE